MNKILNILISKQVKRQDLEFDRKLLQLASELKNLITTRYRMLVQYHIFSRDSDITSTIVCLSVTDQYVKSMTVFHDRHP